MTKRTCTVEGCTEHVHARGWCSSHYSKWRHHGDPLHVPVRLTGVPCAIEGCDKLAVGRGWCSTHWARWNHHGDPNHQRRVITACTVTGCDRAPRSLSSGLCETHYYRLRRTGSLEILPATTTVRYCAHCDAPFEAAARGIQMYCSRQCKQRRDAHHYHQRVRNDVDRDFITTAYVAERDGWRCHLCRKKVQRTLIYPHPMSASVDHVIPLARGGKHRLANVRLAHLACNKAKSTKPMNEQLALIG